MKRNGYLTSAKRFLKAAQGEYALAKKTRNELKARQSAEKGYLSLVHAVNALFIEKGMKEEELPKTERGRKVLLGKYADREWRKTYHALRHILHIETFYDGFVDYKDLDESFEDLQGLIKKAEMAS